MNFRGQVAVEQLFILGLSILLITIIFYFAINYATDSVKVAQAKDTVEKIGKAADSAYSLGPGTKNTISVFLPSDMRFINITGNQVQMRISLSSGDSDVFAKTQATVVGSVPATSGLQNVVLTVAENGNVIIGTQLLSCTPSSITRSIAQNSSASDLVAVANGGTYNITGIVANVTGLDFASVSQPASPLAPGASANANISYNVPLAKPVGTYSGSLVVNGSNSSQCVSALTIFVTSAGGPDTQGPLVSNTAISPASPSAITPITLTATGSDATTGGSVVTGCQAQLDGSGVWNAMSATDGSFSSVTENVTYYLGYLSQGGHNATLYCTDAAGNSGPPGSLSFNVSAASGGNNTTADTQGPLVSNIAISPGSPNSSSAILINATASDSGRGNSNISMCQVAVDGFSWDNMNATDGTYGAAITENVTDALGPYSGGKHSLGIRCNDTAGNWGDIAAYNFTVTQLQTKKDIAFVILNPADWYVDSEEWYGFITSHQSGIGFNWSMDVVNATSISDGSLNLSKYYRIAILCNSNTTNDSNFYPKLLQYEKEGHYVVLLGLGAKDGTRWLGGATATGTAAAAATLVPRTSHYITTGFTVGTTYTVQSASNTQYYNTATSLTQILSTTTTGRLVVGNKSNANDRLLVFAVTRPSTFYPANGTLMAVRAIDWALNNSVPGTG